MRMHRNWARLLAATLAVTVISAASGCGQRDRDTQNGVVDGALRVTDVTVGRSVGGDNRVTDRTTEFGPGDTVFAAVETDRSASGGTLVARWTYQDGQVVDESSRTIVANGETVTAFHIVNPAGWPAGRYRVEVLTNGTVARSEEFTVR
jgi:hypothetical protein